ncbi:hypothetical protein [Novosphingobium sp. AAP83]|nr:hypothetical protein [Novosphingobium sp. AAP83]
MEAEAVADWLLARVDEVCMTGPILYRLNNTLHVIVELPIRPIPA